MVTTGHKPVCVPARAKFLSKSFVILSCAHSYFPCFTSECSVLGQFFALRTGRRGCRVTVAHEQLIINDLTICMVAGYIIPPIC